MKKYHVYCWTNSITKKKYIGYTSEGIITRWNKHLMNARAGHDTYFYRSLRKYNIDVWECEELKVTKDHKVAKNSEKKFIKEYNTLVPLGYNSTEGGNGGNTWFGAGVAKRKRVLSKSKTGDKNPRYSGFTDEEIIKCAADLYETDNNSWIIRNWKKLTHEKGIPKYFTAFRFKEYGGKIDGFKIALEKELHLRGHKKVNLKYRWTVEHLEKLSKSNLGKIWVTEIKTKRSFLIDPTIFNNKKFIRGRNKC